MFVLKHAPEDFEVEEQPVAFSGSGPFAIYRLTKEGMTTFQALQALARHNRISVKGIGYAGLKDRHARTMQYISHKRKDLETAPPLGLAYVSQHTHALAPGELEGNRFAITVRNLHKEDIAEAEAMRSWLGQQGFLLPNYFDEQRFSSKNVSIGRALVQKDFGQAVSLLRDVEQQGSFHAFLQDHPSNPIGALRTLPRKLLRLYLHAYQSYLFNLQLFRELEGKGARKKLAVDGLVLALPESLPEERKLPLIGYGTDPEAITGLGESVSPRDFIFPMLPELSSYGSTRDALVPVKDLSLGEPEPDKAHEGALRQRVSFSLPKGAYGSLVIKWLYMPDQ